jgi:hypothetical protein
MLVMLTHKSCNNCQHDVLSSRQQAQLIRSIVQRRSGADRRRLKQFAHVYAVYAGAGQLLLLAST